MMKFDLTPLIKSSYRQFLLAPLLAVLCARNRRFVLAGVFGMLSAATRLIGVLVIVPIFM